MNEYIKFDGTKGTFTIKDDISLNDKQKLIECVTEQVVSERYGYMDFLFETYFNFFLIVYFTNIEPFKDKAFSFNNIENFYKLNKKSIVDKVVKSIGKDTYCRLKASCNKAIEYRLTYYNPVSEKLSEIVRALQEIKTEQKTQGALNRVTMLDNKNN